MLLLLPVLVQSYSLGNTLPARTRATRCSSVRLAEGKDYMLQELNPAKAGILCVGHPRHPRHPCQALRRCRRPRRPLAAGVADAHSTAQHTQLGHRTRSPLTAHRSLLTARLHPPRRILTWARASQGLRADGFKPNTEAIGDRMVQLKGIDKALPGLAAQANILTLTLTHPHPP